MIGICAVVKNEHLYLKEWLDYHFSIGVEHVWLFEDYGSVSHEGVISEYGDKVTLYSFSITGAIEGNPMRQCAVYDWFCEKFKDKIDWCAFIDVDEFIILQEGETLKSLCDSLDIEPYCGFILYWRLYDANGHIHRPCGSVMENYTHESDYRYLFWTDRSKPLPDKITGICFPYKTVVNMHRTVRKWPVCHMPQNICDVFGKRVDMRMSENTKTFERAYLAHYFTKSWEDWKIRMQRGNIMARNRTAETFFRINADMSHLKEKLISEL